MAKPICVIYYDQERLSDGIRLIPHNAVQGMFDEKFIDYNVLCVPFSNHDTQRELFELEVFFEKDFTEIKYEELKSMISHSIEKVNDKSNK